MDLKTLGDGEGPPCIFVLHIPTINGTAGACSLIAMGLTYLLCQNQTGSLKKGLSLKGNLPQKGLLQSPRVFLFGAPFFLAAASSTSAQNLEPRSAVPKPGVAAPACQHRSGETLAHAKLPHGSGSATLSISQERSLHGRGRVLFLHGCFSLPRLDLKPAQKVVAILQGGVFVDCGSSLPLAEIHRPETGNPYAKGPSSWKLRATTQLCCAGDIQRWPSQRIMILHFENWIESRVFVRLLLSGSLH